VNTKEYDDPFPRELLRKEAGAEASLTTVCEAASWFVHVTVVPFAMARFPGLNAKFWIVTDADPP